MEFPFLLVMVCLLSGTVMARGAKGVRIQECFRCSAPMIVLTLPPWVILVLRRWTWHNLQAQCAPLVKRRGPIHNNTQQFGTIH